MTNSARLENLEDLATTHSSTLELLREAVDLKKLNNNLMKVTMFEDLVADIYAQLYEANVPRFIEQASEENRERMKVDHLLMANDAPTGTPTPPTSAPPSEAPAPRGRTKGIARRDIQKRAEAIVNRHVLSRNVPAKAPAAPAEEETRPAPAAEVPAPLPIRESQRDGATGATSGAQSSVPASIHGSADDESELSEIDDERLAKLKREEKPPLLFPNLPSRKSPDPTSELSAQASADGDEADEGAGDDDEENEIEGDEAEGGIAEEEEGEAEAEGEGEGEGEQDDVDMEGDEGGEAAEEGEGEGEAEEEAAEDNEDEDATEDQPEPEAGGDTEIDVDVDVDEKEQ